MNQVLRNYNRSKTLTKTPQQMVATVFERCAFWMEGMAKCLEEKKYFERYQYSEKVVMALTYLMPLFADASSEQKQFAQEMKEFCFLILAFVTEINQKENLSLCSETRSLLQDMASIWQKV